MDINRNEYSTSEETPELVLDNFTGPLDLLLQLVESREIDIFAIPIVEVTDQYLQRLEQSGYLQTELAADFLVIAATLILIKSNHLLPKPEADEQLSLIQQAQTDLTLRLLAYRRCRYIANFLETHYLKYNSCRPPEPRTASQLGIKTAKVYETELDRELLLKAARNIAVRNELRFQDLSARIEQILNREALTLSERMFQLCAELTYKGKANFAEIYPPTANVAVRIGAFLALLELMRLDQVLVEQKNNMSDIYMSLRNNDIYLDRETILELISQRPDPSNYE